jgi:Flp pilus assembly protein CpaB
MKKRSAIVISGAVALALLAGIVGANRAAITASQPQIVVQHAAQQAPQQPTYTERE